jgi:hypothetical protein
MPSATQTRPKSGMRGTISVAAGSADTVRPIHSTADAPHPIGTSDRNSRCSGISASDSSPAGMIQNAVSGTAATLASTL